jgi:hypothetical protein
MSSLQRRHAKTYSKHLQRALQATHATSYSIAVGFPFGLSLGLTWEPEAQAERERRADEMKKILDAGDAAVKRLKKVLESAEKIVF